MFLKSSLQGAALYENNMATTEQEDAMIDRIAQIVTQSRRTLAEDALGVAALFLVLYAGLSFGPVL